MAWRTNEKDVEGILVSGKQYDGATSPALGPFIDTATALADWLEAEDTDSELNNALLERIEAFLSAHFYAHADQLYQARSTAGASATFQGQTGMILSSTQYGQTAMLLDVTGLLAKRSKEAEEGGKRKVTATWLGRRPSAQTAYRNRR